MKASIITVGDEILIGQIVDTNSAWIGRKLSDIGIKVHSIVSIGDQHQQIVNTIRTCISESDIVFMTGGLGPTKDDITKKAIADCLGVDMYFDQPTFSRIKDIFEKLGRELSPFHHEQCLMPVGVKLLKNSMGTAPGMWLTYHEKPIISMPGVPYEMIAIMEQEVLPILQEKYTNQYIEHRTIRTSCTGETTIENSIKDIIDIVPDYIKVAYLPSIASVRVRLSAQGQNEETIRKDIKYFGDSIVERLGDIVYGEGETTLEQAVMEICKRHHLKLSTAESCTGGAVASRLVSIPGSSSYFYGSIVAYDNEIKKSLLSVQNSVLESHGAVSEQVAIAMALGCIKKLNTDIAVSITGIAGPDGGSEQKPVGSIWICVANNANTYETFFLKTGKDRTKNIEGAVIYAMDMVRKFISKNYK